MSLSSTPRSWVTGETVTSAQMNAEIRDALTGVQAAWTPYTPSLTAVTTDPTLGSGGGTSGRYLQMGKTVIGWAQVGFGTSGTGAGSGIYRVSLPPSLPALTGSIFIGTGRLTCAGVYTPMQALTIPGVLDRVNLRYYTAAVGGTNPDATNAFPGAWTALDDIRFNFAYETS